MRPPPRPAAPCSARLLAAWPVSEMNTSSSVGRCRLMSSMPTPAPSSRRTASAIMPVCVRTGALTVRPSTLGRSMHISLSAVTARSASAGSSSTTSSRSPPIWPLSSSEVPSAITPPWSITTIWSASRSASSRYWVVRSTVVPAATRRLDRLPQREPAARVQAGRRLVEEQHRRAEDQRGRQVEPAAHAAGVGLGGPLRGLGQLEALEQLVGAGARVGARHVVELADHLEVLEAGQVLVDRGVLAGQPDLGAQRGGVLLDVEAGDAGGARVRARAASRGSAPRLSCRRRSARAGPARVPVRAVKSTPRSARTEP